MNNSNLLNICPYSLTDSIVLNPSLLEHVDDILKKDREFILNIVKQNGHAILYADPGFSDDREMILAATVTYPAISSFMDAKFHDDYEIMLSILSRDSLHSHSLTPRLKDNDTIAMAAIRQHGSCLCSFSNRLLNTPEFVLEAVSTCGNALKYASSMCRQNKKIAYTAVANNPEAIRYVKGPLLEDRELALYAVGLGCHIQYLPRLYYNDLEIVLTAIYHDESNIDHLCSAPIIEHPAVEFMMALDNSIKTHEWPLVKRALLERLDAFLNPPDIIMSLVESFENKYFLLAQHALANFPVFDTEPLPELV